MQILIDRINLFSVLVIVVMGRRAESARYFDAITPEGQLWLDRARKFGLLRIPVSPLEECVGHVVNPDGSSGYDDFWHAMRRLCREARVSHIDTHPLMHAMSGIWAPIDLAHAYDTWAERYFWWEVRRLGLAAYLQQQSSTPTVVWIESHFFSKLVAEEAKRRNVSVRFYPCFTSWAYITRNIRSLGAAAVRKFGRLFGIMRKVGETPVDIARQTHAGQPPRFGLQYHYKKIAFSESGRAEFFWFRKSLIPFDEVLIYNYWGPPSLSPDQRSDFQEVLAAGVRILGKGEAAEPMPCSSNFGALVKQVEDALADIAVRTPRRWKQWFLEADYIHTFTRKYSQWVDFYASTGIRTDLAGTFQYYSAQAMALKTLRIPCLAYQYSISNVYYPFISSGEDVLLAFSGPTLQKIFAHQKLSQRGLTVGFTFDHACHNPAPNPDMQAVATDIRKKGASFVIGFFDENSINRWELEASNEQAVDDYQELFTWLVEDPSLGIIVKPKKMSNLFERIKSIDPLRLQAQQTGRLHFLQDENHISFVYPADVARVTDVCLGLLGGATAAFECSLCGAPTVLVDSLRRRQHPWYSQVRGTVVFEDFASLRGGVRAYRASGDPAFGDWRPIYSELDPFRDGRAAERMEQFAFDVYSSLKEGMDRDQALDLATRKYFERWGSQMCLDN